jgi:hypothetical protein
MLDAGPIPSTRNSDSQQHRPGLRRLGSRALADGIFAMVVVVIVAYRFLVLSDGGAPATIDAGNWLAFGDAIFGDGTRSSTIVYPPVVPLLTKGFVEAFGVVNGVAALGALASAAPAAGLYVGLRTSGIGFQALPGALLVLGAGAVGEATAWGGFPQLIGLGLASLVLFELDRFLRTRNRVVASKAGVLMMLLLASSHFVGLTVAAAGLGMFVMEILWPRRRRLPWGEVVGGVALLIVPSLWLMPMYLDLAGAFAGTSGDFRFLNQLTWSNLAERIEFLYRDSPNLWRIALPFAMLTPVVFARYRFSPVWRVLCAVVVSASGLALLSREGRFLYFATLAVGLAATLWIQSAGRVLDNRAARRRPSQSGRAAKVALLVAALGLAAWQVQAGAAFFREQRNYYGILTPGLHQGLMQIRDTTPQDTVLAVTSVRDAPLGWWVEAITHRPTYYASALRWLSFEDELERARIGNQIFTRTFPDNASVAVAEEHGVDLLIVPTRWAHFDADLLGPTSAVWPTAYFSATDVVVLPVED